MFQSPILDVGIGLVLVYLVLSLACTAINEYIAQILALRAQTLLEAVLALFQNSEKAEKFVEDLYDHDLIDALSPPKEAAKPSYIPADIFSLALIDKLGLHQAQGEQANGQIADRLEQKGQELGIDANIIRTLMPLAVSAGDDI